MLKEEQKSFESEEIVTVGDMVGLPNQLYKYFATLLQLKIESSNLKHLENFLQTIDMIDVNPWQALQERVNNRKATKTYALTPEDRIKDEHDDLLLTFQPDSEGRETPKGVLRTMSQWQVYKQNTLTTTSRCLIVDFEKNIEDLKSFIKKGLEAQFLPALIEIIAITEDLIARNIAILNGIPPNLNPEVKIYLQKNLDNRLAEYVEKFWDDFQNNSLEHLFKLNILVQRYIFRKPSSPIPPQVRAIFKDFLPINECLKVALEVPKDLKKRHHCHQEYNFRQHFLDLVNNAEQDVTYSFLSEYFVFNSAFTRPEPQKAHNKKVYVLDQ